MTPDKIVIAVISGISLLVSLSALVLTYRQKAAQDRLGTRKTLSDLISSISTTNIEMAKIRDNAVGESVMLLRRALNSQRRYLSQHAELLSEEIPALCTDIDHVMIAGAMDASGNTSRADHHWQRAIELSPASIIKSYNLRGYARFLAAAGKIQPARKAYEQALGATSQDDDRHRRERADTLVLWALAERDLGFDAEASRLREQAIAEAKRIGSVGSQNDMLQYIESHWARAAAV